jgi:hypothetical protein
MSRFIKPTSNVCFRREAVAVLSRTTALETTFSDREIKHFPSRTSLGLGGQRGPPGRLASSTSF